VCAPEQDIIFIAVEKKPERIRHAFQEEDRMLVLSRKTGEKVCIGNDVTFVVLEISGRQVRIGIDAPTRVRILRQELCEPPSEAGVRTGTPANQELAPAGVS
jgi:carbon storage regulator